MQSRSSISIDQVSNKYHFKDISEFLVEMSELYADASYVGLKHEDIIKKTREKLIEWRCHNVDVASYINKPVYKNGETELMTTFRWARYLSTMCDWFKLLCEFGGNPYQTNKDGLDAYDIARGRFKEEGLEEEFNDFVLEVEYVQKRCV